MEQQNSSKMHSTLMVSLFHHVALPLRLPGNHDKRIDDVNSSLNSRLIDAVRTILQQQWDAKTTSCLESVKRSLETCMAVNTHGRLCKPTLLEAFRSLLPDDFIMLHIPQQNAGLVIRMGEGDTVIFEAFEASAPCTQVMAAKNALLWTFPGSAVSVPASEFRNESFQIHLASFLEQASTESIKQFAATTHKAGSNAFESRDSADPSVITQLLMTMLQAIGKQIPVPRIKKRVRDDASWDDAEVPWRRSSFWLAIRATIQRHLSVQFDDDGNGEIGRVIYKFMICLVISGLLTDCFPHVYLESSDLLKRKLCRRLAKLAADMEKASPKVRAMYERLFLPLGRLFAGTVDYTSERINTAWNQYKANLQGHASRKVTNLPQTVEAEDMQLTMPNCHEFLSSILAVPLRDESKTQSFLESRTKSKFTNVFRSFAKCYFNLADADAAVGAKLETRNANSDYDLGDIAEYERDCLDYCKDIRQYLAAGTDAYANDAEQMSLVILNTMRLWVAADEAAVKAFPLLKEYRPVFRPEILDVLQLLHEHDLERLQAVQEYLAKRYRESMYGTIYAEPTRGCFAERYFEESEFSDMFKKLQERIEDVAEQDRLAKEQEWKRLSAEYEDLMQKIAAGTCTKKTADVFPFESLHDDRKCVKCFRTRVARRMKIVVFEHPLPADEFKKRAVIFELAIPKAFAVYRSITWRILSSLAFQIDPSRKAAEPRLHLYDYRGLFDYVDRKYEVSLASKTKSFLYSHWSKVSLPVALDQVCLPNGLDFAYFDSESKLWPGDWPHRPNFQHHCRLTVPSTSPFSFVNAEKAFEPEGNGPTSFEILAGQTKCPTGLNPHEFMAFQGLLSGRARRWSQMLVELGSSNLNFSTEATSALYCYLTLQAGPYQADETYRVIHHIFRDNSFRTKLIEQILHRLEVISENWRETHCMEILLALILKLWALQPEGKSPVPTIVDELLDRARTILIQWVRALRKEVYQATDIKTADRMSRYLFWTALLCRRTFLPYSRKSLIGPMHLSLLCEASMALQDSVAGNPSEFPQPLKNALVRDLKMIHSMRKMIKQSIYASPASIIVAIEHIWSETDGETKRKFLSIKFLDSPDDYWVELCVAATELTRQQMVRYHILEGHLLIDGKPLGKLPPEYRRHAVLQELFGDQNLLTFPSALAGMSYQLLVQVSDNEVHVGFRGDKLIVRARHKQVIYEHIDRSLLEEDLPASLVENCVHWLNIRTGRLECRQKPKVWYTKESNWTVDCKTRKAYRRQSQLIDPHSDIFARIAAAFDDFEYRRNLTVYQVQGTIRVELKRLELRFQVNKRGLLESQELNSEFDPNQDAGTWYGLRSKIVLRDIRNFKNRSIIVPMGPIKYEKDGLHIASYLENVGFYGRFNIDSVLGRIVCPVEPWLLFKKAELHAYTSFFIPDPLTGRTGTEEALHILTSGYCQPWQPLAGGSEVVLSSIAKLTPKREYYPENLKFQQVHHWNKDLSEYMQSESYRPIIDNIYRKSDQLSAFVLEGKKSTLTPLESAGEGFLLERARFRRNLYYRVNSDPTWGEVVSDTLYEHRDSILSSQRNMRVFETVALLKNWPSKMYAPREIPQILQKWPNIGGFTRFFDKVLITDKLEMDLAIEWGALICSCKLAKSSDAYKLMFLLGPIAFGKNRDMNTIRLFLAYSVFDELKTLRAPMHSAYSQYRQGQIPSITSLTQMVKPYLRPLVEGQSGNIPFASYKQHKKARNAQMRLEEENEIALCAFVKFLLAQWPCPTPEALAAPGGDRIDIEAAMRCITPEWQRWYQNHDLTTYLDEVQAILEARHTGQAYQKPVPLSNNGHTLSERIRGHEIPTLHSLVSKPGPQSWSSKRISLLREEDTRGSTFTLLNAQFFPREVQELQSIVHEFSFSESTIRKKYAADLTASIEALKLVKVAPFAATSLTNENLLSAEINGINRTCVGELDQIRKAFREGDSREQWLNLGGLWPCTSRVSLLETLQTKAKTNFGTGMKEAIVQHASSITALQRSLRIYDAARKKQVARLAEEQKNDGHKNWRAIDHTDWLLIELDSNILIREDQVDVALATISPASGSNSVLQMNMGKGKTSCIMPMAAAELADSKTLTRLIVPKALLLQTAQLLQARLGGLLGRTITHVPFSRKTPTTLENIRSYYKIHQEAMKTSGVIVTLPEHVLSFMLSGLQRLSDGQIPEADKMITIQSWFSRVARDILDECDHTISVRTQLVYPGGVQLAVDGHPHRWETAEALLKIVDVHMWDLQQLLPRSMEVVRAPGRKGGFPVIHFLRKDVEERLLERIVDDICTGKTSILPTRDLSAEEQDVIKNFISCQKPDATSTQRIEEIFADNRAAKQNTYLLRGLLVHRILLLCLKKRWNVQYGLHPDRHPIAVPFHAKGVPSEAAEWGHPDVSIIFTILAFYYAGLSMTQLSEALRHVLKSNDPASAYERWTHTSEELPDALKEWNVINVDDEGQMSQLWEHLRYTVTVIDYYLNHFCFPKHGKQFKTKLQASGWDIPLLAIEAPKGKTAKGKEMQVSRAMTTGFSGTNDNRSMLPLTIKQDDLPSLAHTNAEVLTYLLQERNRRYFLAAANSKHFTELELLDHLNKQKTRILIDAGAHILSMENRVLAESWLRIDNQATAAIYFDKFNKAWVLYRNGTQVPLLASPFAEDMTGCLVYLDEAHTRGTDLKLPPHAVGALTLGLGQTKDHTVQAAMRLRQLGTTQSVVFYAAPEVHNHILDFRRKGPMDKLSSKDVIIWLLEQTCSANEQLQPLFFSQGADFCKRQQAAIDNPNVLTRKSQREAYLDVLRQREAQTLQRLYGVKTKTKTEIRNGPWSAQIGVFMKELNTLKKGFQDSGNAVHGSALQEVEQEREVANEIETVREVQRQLYFSPMRFGGLHKDLQSFVHTGRLPAVSYGTIHILSAFRQTGLGLKYNIIPPSPSASKLFVSTEFMRTVQLPKDQTNDNFLRPVNWILWSTVTETAVIVIPEEVEAIIPILEYAEKKVVHLIAYAAPVTRRMLHFNNLTFFAIPPLPTGWEAPKWLKVELGIFAGRLFFNFDEYEELKRNLGISENGKHFETLVAELDAMSLTDTQESSNGMDTTDDEHGSSALEKAIAMAEEKLAGKNKNKNGPAQRFTTKPLTFLQEWLSMRRKGQDFAHTPMGAFVQGKPLQANHPFFGGIQPRAIQLIKDMEETPTQETFNRDPEEDVGYSDYDDSF